MGLASTRGYRKCAKIVGEVMGNYHPHGDASIYDTLVRMAQDFNMRYAARRRPGQLRLDRRRPAGGDALHRGAPRSRSADEMMADLDKETVDFVPNYDETTEEPTVLPAPFPNLLVNGSTGIAVGMATNIPPHNMREVIDAASSGRSRAAQSDDAADGWRRSSASCSSSSRARLPDRRLHRRPARHPAGLPDRPRRGHHARQGRDRGRRRRAIGSSIVIAEIPYQVNKARLIERIADLVREKTIEGISDIRDESDRDGMRIVIELKRGEVGEVVLNNLYKHTQLQSSFGIIMLAIVGGRPKVLTLVELIDNFIEFRREVVRRRTEFELRKAEARAPHPRRAEDRARPPRRGDRADPRGEEPGRGARRA